MQFRPERRSLTGVAFFLFACCFAPAQTTAGNEGLALKSQHVKQLMSEGRFAEAIEPSQELLRALPSNTGLRLNLALAYHMAGRHAEAVPEFERVIRADPSNFPALISLGASLLALNQPVPAIPRLRKAVVLQPANANARGMLANALLSQDRAQEALIHFRRLTELTPADPKAWFGLGRTYEALANAAFQALDKTAQGSAEWLAVVGDSRMERRQYRSAFYFYRQALEKNSRLPGIHEAIAEVYRRTSHDEWAKAEDAKSRGSSSGGAASALTQIRSYNREAVRSFAHLGTLPASVELHSLRATIMSSHGQHQEAAAEWQAALKLDRSDRNLQLQSAAELYRAGNYGAAEPALRSLVGAEPGNADVNFLLGDTLLRSEHPDQSLPFLESAVLLNSGFVAAQASLGLALMRLDRHSEAIPHLQAALSTDEDGSLHLQLARAYGRIGDAENSKRMTALYQEIQKRSAAEEQKLDEQGQITAP